MATVRGFYQPGLRGKPGPEPAGEHSRSGPKEQPRKGLLWERARHTHEDSTPLAFGHWRRSSAQTQPKSRQIGRFWRALADAFSAPGSAWQVGLRPVGRSTGGSVDKLGVGGSSPSPPTFRKPRSCGVFWFLTPVPSARFRQLGVTGSSPVPPSLGKPRRQVGRRMLSGRRV
jgi:hypothetical protein